MNQQNKPEVNHVGNATLDKYRGIVSVPINFYIGNDLVGSVSAPQYLVKGKTVENMVGHNAAKQGPGEVET